MYIVLNFSKSILNNKLLENEKLPNANTHLNRVLRKYNFRSRKLEMSSHLCHFNCRHTKSPYIHLKRGMYNCTMDLRVTKGPITTFISDKHSTIQIYK